jgi:ATP synthase protein I
MDNKDWKLIIKNLSLLTHLGLLMVANLGVGFISGYFLDNFLNTNIVFKITGLILGIGSGFYSNYRLIRQFMGDDKDVHR